MPSGCFSEAIKWQTRTGEFPLCLPLHLQLYCKTGAYLWVVSMKSYGSSRQLLQAEVWRNWCPVIWHDQFLASAQFCVELETCIGKGAKPCLVLKSCGVFVQRKRAVSNLSERPVSSWRGLSAVERGKAASVSHASAGIHKDQPDEISKRGRCCEVAAARRGWGT